MKTKNKKLDRDGKDATNDRGQKYIDLLPAELADVFNYACLTARFFKIDLESAILEKLDVIEKRRSVKTKRDGDCLDCSYDPDEDCSDGCMKLKYTQDEASADQPAPNAPQEQKKCECCGRLSDNQELRENPFQAEINEDHSLHVICSDCYTQSCEDI